MRNLQLSIKEQKKIGRICGIVERFVDIEKAKLDVILSDVFLCLTLNEQKNLLRQCGVVEKFIHNKKVPGVRSDLFGIFDLVAIDPEKGIIGIQSCGGDFASHYRKITEQKAEMAIKWLSAGRGRTKIEIWAWRKVVEKRGAKKKIWSPRIKEITYDDFKGKYRADFKAA